MSIASALGKRNIWSPLATPEGFVTVQVVAIQNPLSRAWMRRWLWPLLVYSFIMMTLSRRMVDILTKPAAMAQHACTMSLPEV
jgi:hypothetical protein